MVRFALLLFFGAHTFFAQEVSDCDAFIELRARQQRAHGALYVTLEKEAAHVLKKNAGSSYRVWWHHILHKVPRLIIQLLFIVSVWLSCYGLLYRSWFFGLSSIVLAFLMGLLLWLSYYESTLQWGVCKVPDAPLYIGPDTRYPICGTLGYFTEVPLYKKQGDWFFVGGAVRGWVKCQDMGYRV